MVITSDINSIRKEFPKFEVVDKDGNFIYLRGKNKKRETQVIEGRINRGSLGDFDVRFIVEKQGCRSRIIGGRPQSALKRVKSYLKSNKC